MEPVVRVATVNILNDLSRWQQRLPLLVDGLASLSLDLIALQEVTDPLGCGTAGLLADALGGYYVFACPKSGWGRRWEGIAILSRLPVTRHEVLDLGSQQRTAQRVEFEADGHPVILVNGHFYWPPGVQGARVRQVELLLAWVASNAPCSPVILCGDFNATPESQAIVRVKRSFASAHEAAHGCDPAYTCPTPLISGGRIRGPVTRGVLRTFSNVRGESWRGTLDYIFVSPGLRVADCELILDRPSPDDQTLYASDHFGLSATLELERPAC
jgi:endonuclease/exonuclease/phosphatase family metal-dependent hydrolase